MGNRKGRAPASLSSWQLRSRPWSARRRLLSPPDGRKGSQPRGTPVKMRRLRRQREPKKRTGKGLGGREQRGVRTSRVWEAERSYGSQAPMISAAARNIIFDLANLFPFRTNAGSIISPTIALLFVSTQRFHWHRPYSTFAPLLDPLLPLGNPFYLSLQQVLRIFFAPTAVVIPYDFTAKQICAPNYLGRACPRGPTMTSLPIT